MKYVLGKIYLVLGIFVVLCLPLILPSDYFRTVMNIALINCIVVLGFNFIYGYTGYISFAQAAFMGVGAYTSALLAVDFHLPFTITLIAAAVIAGICGLILGIPGVRLRGHYLAIVTIGFTIVTQLVMINWKEVTKGPDGITNIPAPSIGAWAFDNVVRFYYLALTLLVALAFIAFRIERSKVGRALMSIREDELAASTCGVNIKYYKVLAFVLSAVYAGVGGSLYAHMLSYISPDNFSFDQSIVIFTMALVGGVGNIWGPMIGAILLTFIPEWLRFLKAYYMAAYGIGIMLLMLYLPGGIVSLITKWKDRVVIKRRAKNEVVVK